MAEAHVENYVRMMSIWIDASKSCIQMALAALVLPVFFLRKVLGVPETAALRPYLDSWLLLSWAFLCVSIGSGLLYQITASRLVGDALVGTQSRRQYPHQLFWLMSASFFAGIVAFMAGVVLRR
ncbi:hypothetical protein AWB78_02429 [Caballeronia calidae]|uniref:Uncharacterized protein n=2 Tax=Caballeronia calidae TaxID=1777139 RepID=A0A158BBB4_9BURK|nr:hypothetical protein AWB78_02429 [Caballeronia calidae]